MSARRGLAVALWLAVLALCAVQVARTRFVADLSSFLPAAPTAEQRLLVDQLREGALSRVMLLGVEGADAATRARLSRALAAALARDPRFATVANGASAGLAREKDFVFAHRYALSPEARPERYTAAGLRAAIGETLALLASPAGMLVKPLVANDPTGETLAILAALRPAQGPRSSDGVWVSRDGERALLVARTAASGADIEAQAQALDAAQRAFADAVAGAGPAARDARLVATGAGVFSVRSRAMIQHDVVLFSLLSTAAVALLLLAAYRSALALVLGLVPVVTGALVGVTAVSLGFGVVHGITLGFGTTLIGEAVDYAIYLFVQSGRAERAGDAAWLADFWPTVRLGVLTSIAGFSALLFSGLPGLAQLGLYSIAGLAAAALATRFVLPRLLPARFEVRDLTNAGRAIAAWAARARGLGKPVILVAVLAVLVVIAHGPRAWDLDIASLNPISTTDRALDAGLRADLGTADARYMVVVRGASLDAALASAERAGEALDPLVADGRLGGYDSPARFLPSAATQRARLASLPDAERLRASLREALAGQPLRAERLEPFVADAERARGEAPFTRAALAGTAFESAVDGMLFADGAGTWTALLALRPPAGKAVDAGAVRTALASAPGASFLDVKGELDTLYSGYFRRALAMSAVGLAVIVALLFAALRSPARVLRVMAPLAAGVAIVAAGQLLAGTRLSILHLVGLLLVVAVGSNYALFFDRLRERPAAMQRTLASLALANATTVASFGLLSLSSIPVLHALGSTVAAGAFLTLVFSAALVPPARAAPPLSYNSRRGRSAECGRWSIAPQAVPRWRWGSCPAPTARRRISSARDSSRAWRSADTRHASCWRRCARPTSRTAAWCAASARKSWSPRAPRAPSASGSRASRWAASRAWAMRRAMAGSWSASCCCRPIRARARRWTRSMPRAASRNGSRRTTGRRTRSATPGRGCATTTATRRRAWIAISAPATASPGDNGASRAACPMRRCTRSRADTNGTTGAGCGRIS